LVLLSLTALSFGQHCPAGIGSTPFETPDLISDGNQATIQFQLCNPLAPVCTSNTQYSICVDTPLCCYVCATPQTTGADGAACLGSSTPAVTITATGDLLLTYSGGEPYTQPPAPRTPGPRIANIVITCDHSAGLFTYSKYIDGTQGRPGDPWIYFVYGSSAAVCSIPGISVGNMTGGAIFLLILLLLIVVYLGVGVAYNRFAKGELSLPHVEFWTEVWVLFKMGVFFVFGKITNRKFGSGYEQI